MLDIIGIPRSGFSLIISSLDYLIKWNWDQRKILQLINLKLGKILTEALFSSFCDSYLKNIIFNGEFIPLTGGPKKNEPNHLVVRKYLGVKDMGDIIFDIKFHKNFNALMHLQHGHSFPKNFNNDRSVIMSRRNPCGILESSFHSLNAMTSEYIQKFRGDLDLNDIENLRNLIALYKFSRKDVCNALIDYQTQQSSEMIKFIKSSKNHLIIDWEEIIDKQSNSLNTISEFLQKNNYQIESDVSKTNKFYNQINTNILEFHQHNFRSGHALRDGWIFGSPNIVSEKITNNILELTDNDLIFLNKKKHKENLYLNKIFQTDNAKKGNDLINSNQELIFDIDKNIKEFSMNKSNLDPSKLREENICNLKVGNFITINKMSKSLEYFIDIFKNLDSLISLFNEIASQKKLSQYDFFNNLRPNIKLMLSIQENIYENYNN